MGKGNHMASRRVRTMTGKGSWMWELNNSRTHSNSRALAWEISWGSHLCALPIHARYVLSSYHPLTGFPPSVSFPLPHSFWWLTFSIPLLPYHLFELQPSHNIFHSYNYCCFLLPPQISSVLTGIRLTMCHIFFTLGLCGQGLARLWIHILCSITAMTVGGTRSVEVVKDKNIAAKGGLFSLYSPCLGRHLS